MDPKYENINLINNDYKGKTTPVVEIESDEISTNTPNNIYEETENLNINFTDDYNNWSNFTLSSKFYADDYSVICLVKINDFRKFLEDNITIEINKVEFYLQKYNRQLLTQIRIIPTQDNFSVRIQFIEDKEFKSHTNEIKTKKSKSNNQKRLDNFLFSGNCMNKNSNKGGGNNFINSIEYSDEIYSREFQNLLKQDEITIDINMGIYTRIKRFFTKNKKEKLKLNLKNEVVIDEYFEYEGLVYEKLVDPFIFRIKLTTPGYSKEKCEDFIGICNEGNTCYMNSIIQSLFHIKHLRKAIYKIPSAEDSPIYSIQKVFYSLQNEKNSIKLLHLFKSLSWEKSFWNSQQDAQEIFSYLFNFLSEQEKNYLDDSAELANLCEGKLNSMISCKDIKLESIKEEKFLFLQLDLENSGNLIECIEKFISVESLTGDNRYETEDKIKHEATRTFIFSKIPQILFVHLKRFKCDGIDSIKVHQKIEYPDQLELANYCSSKVDELLYSLYGVIVHDGSLNSGHYFVFIKDFNNNKWFKFNDTKVTYSTEYEVFDQNFGGTEISFQITENGEIIQVDSEILRTAYILIYVQKDKINFLFDELKNQDIPESLVDMLTSKKRSNANLTLNPKKNVDPYYPKIYEFCRHNSNNIDYNNYSNKNELKTISRESRSKVAAIKSQNFYGTYNNLDIGSETSNRKVKNEDRNTSIIKNNTSKRLKTHPVPVNKENQGLGKNYNKNTNSATSEEQDIIIDINDDNLSNIKPFYSNISNEIPPFDRNFTKKFINDNKNLIRKLNFKFIDNKTNIFIEEVIVDKSLDKKITALGLIEESYKKLKSRDVDLKSTKIVVLNNMGLFIRIVDDNEDISNLLGDFHQKKIFLCIYVLDLDTLLGFNNGIIVSLHMMKKGFDSLNNCVNIHDKQKYIPKPPIIIKDENMMKNENEFKNCLLVRLKEMFTANSSSEYNFRLIENTDGLLEIQKYTQVKVTKTFGTFEFVRISKREIEKDRIVRMVVESSNF